MDLNSTQDLDALLKQASDAYYNTGTPIMSDAEYDALQESTGKANPIGAKPRQDTRFPVLKHEIPMCSLNKAKTQAEVDGWIQAMKIQPEWLICECKYDGLSLSVTYENGKLINAILRGDGFEGENVIDNAKKFVPLEVPEIPVGRFVLRGEVVISKTNFEKLPKGEYANRRNCVSGIIRRLDGKYCEYLDLMCYDLRFPTAADMVQSEVGKLSTVTSLNRFKVAKVWHYSPELLKELETIRDGEYLLDGVVIKHNDSILTEKVGVGANGNPLLQIAYKFPSEAGATYVKDVKWEIGKTGSFTPICEVEPVTIQGSTISRVSLASYNQFLKLGLAKDKKVFVRRVNDVIPQISASITAKLVQDRELIPLEVPKVCPHCGSEIKTKINDKGECSNIYCSNENCPGALIQALAENLKTKLKTKGFGESVCRQLVEEKYVKNISDIYTLTADEIAQATKMKPDRAKQFYEALHTALKNAPLHTFIDLFNIEGLAGKSLKDLCSKYTLEELMDMSLEDCIKELKKAKGTSFYNSKEKLKEYILIVDDIRKNTP